MFDINDFDETLPGPWEWDVKRLAASFEVAGRDRGFAAGRPARDRAAKVGEYRQRMREARGCDPRRLVRAHERRPGHRADPGRGARHRLGKKEAQEAAQDIAKARTRDSVRVFAKRAGEVDGKLRIVRDPPLIMPIEDLVSPEAARQSEQAIQRLILSYRRTLAREHHPIEEFRYVHMARKVVGVGSVGTRCWILLMVGRDQTTRFSCRRRRPSRRCSSGSSARASTATTASGSWPASS